MSVKIKPVKGGWIAVDVASGRIVAWDSSLCFLGFTISENGWTVAR
jgi:hypothetical protein